MSNPTPESLQAEYEAFKVGKCSAPARASATRISEIGHPCVAYLAFTRIAGEQRSKPDATLASIFDEGRKQEQSVMVDLREMGYECVEDQRAVYWNRFELSGHPDCKLAKNGWHIPLEIKSVSPFGFAKMNSEADIRNHKSYFYAKWIAQIQIYMLLESCEEYWLVLKNKATGQIKIIPIKLDLEYAEQFLKKAEQVKDGVLLYSAVHLADWQGGWLRDHRLNDPKICADCPFKSICLPEIDSGPGAFLMGGEIEEMLNERAKVQEASKQFEELDAEIKDAAKRVFEAGHTEIVCGNWHIQGTKQERKGKAFWVTSITKINP